MACEKHSTLEFQASESQGQAIKYWHQAMRYAMEASMALVGIFFIEGKKALDSELD